MARAGWKYYFFKDFEVEQYSDYLFDDLVLPQVLNNKRHNTIHLLNYFLPVDIHTGKWTIDRKFNKYFINFKLGQFTKNRKPFYFRSKKKRFDTKKNRVF